ncbi:MAG TPA: ABC transporter permease [Thermomicrobiales bacterium]|nr:ABC transporter permease [Thermomicrobiales bacterium]
MAKQTTVSETTPASALAGAFSEVRVRPSGWRRALRLLRRNYAGIVGLFVLLMVGLAALFAPVLAPYDPAKQEMTERLTCPAFTSCPRYGTNETIHGSSEHWLGTDALGRDILSRLIYGARVSVIVGITAVFLGAVAGSSLGLIAGFYGGFADTLIMRIGDIFLAFPYLLLAIAIVAVLGGGLLNVILVLAIAGWVPYARLIRGSVLAAREHEYITAARAIGVRDSVLLARHMLPNVVTPIIVYGTFAVAATIIAEAGLSYLGLGVGTKVPTWGNMLADGRTYMSTAWWLTTLPGIAIMITVLSINLIGDWLRDALDPQLRNLA